MVRTMKPRAFGRAEIAHEALIDLDLVQREAAQIVERRIAGAEVVHRDAQAEPAQRVKRGDRVRVVAEQDRLGDLELEPLRRQAGRRQRGRHMLQELAALELRGRHVDRKLDVLRPVLGFGAGALQHPGAERHDQSDLFGDRDELRRARPCRAPGGSSAAAPRSRRSCRARGYRSAGSTARTRCWSALRAGRARARGGPAGARPSPARRSARCRGRPPWRGRARRRSSSAASRSSSRLRAPARCRC